MKGQTGKGPLAVPFGSPAVPPRRDPRLCAPRLWRHGLPFRGTSLRGPSSTHSGNRWTLRFTPTPGKSAGIFFAPIPDRCQQAIPARPSHLSRSNCSAIYKTRTGAFSYQHSAISIQPSGIAIMIHRQRCGRGPHARTDGLKANC